MGDFYKLNGTQLKLFAALIMVIDHIGAVILPQYIILRIIGRISFPIFCFMAAEGFYYTSDLKKYMLRLFIAGIITEPVYNLAFTGTLQYMHQNVMFTFLCAAAAVYIGKMFPEKLRVLSVIPFVFMAYIANVLNTDYGAFGVTLIWLFYILRDKKFINIAASGVLQIAGSVGIQRYSVFSLIPIALYNGRKGKKIKYFFYIFYPGHLMIIYIAALYLGIY